MLVQAGLCQACSENTLLIFPRGGSNDKIDTFFYLQPICVFIKTNSIVKVINGGTVVNTVANVSMANWDSIDVMICKLIHKDSFRTAS